MTTYSHARLAQAAAELRHPLHVSPVKSVIVERLRALDLVAQLGDELLLLGSCSSLVTGTGWCRCERPGPSCWRPRRCGRRRPSPRSASTRTIWSMNAEKFVSSASSENETLPIAACTLPPLSTRNSILPAFDLAHGAADVERDRAGLRVRHETARAEHAPELADLTHLVRRRDHDVEVEPAFLDLRDVLDADEIGAGLLASRALSPTAIDEHAHRLAGAGRQHDGAADDLVGVTRIDAEPDGDFDGLVELRERVPSSRSRAPASADTRTRSSRPFAAARYFLPCVRISPSPRDPSSAPRRRPSPSRTRSSRS